MAHVGLPTLLFVTAPDLAAGAALSPQVLNNLGGWMTVAVVATAVLSILFGMVWLSADRSNSRAEKPGMRSNALALGKRSLLNPRGEADCEGMALVATQATTSLELVDHVIVGSNGETVLCSLQVRCRTADGSSGEKPSSQEGCRRRRQAVLQPSPHWQLAVVGVRLRALVIAELAQWFNLGYAKQLKRERADGAGESCGNSTAGQLSRRM
jgi:hypothetical protein